MILDSLANASTYRPLGPRFAAAFDYLKKTDVANLAAGKYPIDGDNIFALVQENQLKPGEGVFEAHRKYVDVQVILSGSERFGYANLAGVKVTKDYDDKDDYLLGDGKGTFFVVPEGNFVIFYPHDAHMPGGAPGNDPVKVKKVVVKVRL
jgi:YhcH/YjgK/YiaL family protein